MNEVITSNQNKNIKHIKSLHSRKYREQLGQYIIEGEKLICEAFEYAYSSQALTNIRLAAFSESAIKKENMQELKDECIEKQINYLIFEDKLFKDLCETETPQGVLAIVDKFEYDINKIINKEVMNIIILDEIRDPGNLGTIIRTADACNLDGVILSKGCVDLYNGKSIRATMGSVFHLPVINDVDILELVKQLNFKGVQTICADPYGDTSTFELPPFDRNAIIIGNEAKGVNDELKKIIAHSVKIPMPGKAESLNAGIAAALMMYEISVRKKVITQR